MDYEDAKAVFRQFDIDNSGGIDEVELFAALSDFGLSAQDCDDIFYELDTDGCATHLLLTPLTAANTAAQ